MPPAKKTECKYDIPCRIWCGCKEVGHGFLVFLSTIFDFIVKILEVALKYTVWVLLASAIFMFSAAIFIYLVSAGLGLKENATWHLYLDNQIQQFSIDVDETVETEVEVVE